MTKKIRYEISPDGIHIDAEGFSGGTCLEQLKQLSQFLEANGIENKIGEQKMKSVGYAKPEQNKTLVRR